LIKAGDLHVPPELVLWPADQLKPHKAVRKQKRRQKDNHIARATIRESEVHNSVTQVVQRLHIASEFCIVSEEKDWPTQTKA
jgi:hypothetical protein